MNLSTNIPEVVLTGSAQERGLKYGVECRSLIEKNIAFYRELISLPTEKLNEHAIKLAEKVEAFNPNLKIEMDAIAEGAKVAPVDIYMLNARTELLAIAGQVNSECSSFFFPKTKILFENWDWLEGSRELTVVLSITLENGNKILTYTEAGIVGKVGTSSKGFAVGFNYLFPEPSYGGLPIHVLLRTLLESNSYSEAYEILNRPYPGTSGNILLGSIDGESVDAELSGVETKLIPGTENAFGHVNHYLSGTENREEAGTGFLHNSFERAERLSELLSEHADQTIADAKSVLNDRKPGGGMLCRDFLVEDPGDGKTGTIASIIIDLNSSEMQICLAPQVNSTFQSFSFNN